MKKENIEIRMMRTEDWEEIVEIYAQGIESGISTFRKDVPSLEEFNTSKKVLGRLVAVIENKVVGWVSLSHTSSREDYRGVKEVSVYIHEGYKKRGIGKLLMNELISISEENNIWTLQAIILEDNIGSLELHKKCGFREVGYREKIAKNKFGEWKDTILLERRSKKVF